MRQLITFHKRVNKRGSPHELNTIPETVLRAVQFYSSNKKDSYKKNFFYTSSNCAKLTRKLRGDAIEPNSDVII